MHLAQKLAVRFTSFVPNRWADLSADSTAICQYRWDYRGESSAPSRICVDTGRVQLSLSESLPDSGGAKVRSLPAAADRRSTGAGLLPVTLLTLGGLASSGRSRPTAVFQ
jgi:hypothetical protein